MKDRNSSNRGLKNCVMLLALLYGMYKILSSLFIMQELSSEDTSSILTVPCVVLIAVCSGIMLNDYCLLLPLVVAMVYEVVASVINIAMLLLTDELINSFDLPDHQIAMILSLFQSYGNDLRRDPYWAIAREAFLILFYGLTCLVTIFQIFEIAKKEREIEERREREKELAHLLHQHLRRIHGIQSNEDNGISSRIALHSTAIRNRFAYSGMTLPVMPLATHKRRTRHRVIAIPTVSKAKKLEERRLKSKDYIDKLWQRIMILGDNSLTVNREKVAHNMPRFVRAIWNRKYSKARSSYRYTLKAMHIIVEALFKLIPNEQDSHVLIWLLRLGSELCSVANLLYVDTTPFHAYVAINVIDENPPIRVRYEALHLVYNYQMHFNQTYNKEVQDIVTTCIEVLTAFTDRNGQLARNCDSPYYGYYQQVGAWEDAVVEMCICILNFTTLTTAMKGEIMRSDGVMRPIFKSIRLECDLEEREQYSQPSEASELLSNLLDRPAGSDRIHLITRFKEDLKMAFMKMGSHGLTRALRTTDVTEIIATDETALKILWKRIILNSLNNEFLYDESDRWKLAALILFYGAVSRNELQRILGMGFLLPTAQFFAAMSRQGDYEECTIFSMVLAARPEWKQSFKKAIQGLGTTSHTARLGLTIGASRTKKADYLME